MIKKYDFKLNNFNKEYYRIYEETKNRNFERIPSFKILKKFMSIEYGDIILDAGCGAGHILNFIKNEKKVSAFGVDFSETALELAFKNFPGPNYSKQDLQNLNFADNMFDRILCFNVIEHLSETEQDKTMHEFKRVLKYDGVLVIGTNIRDSIQWWLYQKTIGEHTHVHEFNVKEFKTFVSKFFKIIDYKKSSGVFRFSPPLSWIFHYIFKGDIIIKCKKA